MKIDVTITGTDDQTPPEDVLKISEEYKHIKIEWGLLISKSNEGSPQYPSPAYIGEFIDQVRGVVDVAGHLNGRYLRDLMQGLATYSTEYPKYWQGFKRIQLNFAKLLWHVDFSKLKHDGKPYIFQIEGVNDYLFDQAINSNINCFPLFDRSLGEGITPDSWPKPIHPFYNGYAGGLGPDNLAEQLKRIEEVVGTGTIWIDMTTKVRSNNKLNFDKVRHVLDLIGTLQP
jgi:hypothetical protein